MGQVYEAEELDSGRRVALKLLSRDLGDEEERQRFLSEGRLAASLSHPNCVYVFGTSEIQGFPVIAMELVPEGTLKDRVVPGTPMAAAEAVDAVLQVIAGLEAAASIGILHRDIKPSNCFVHRDGRVLVGDFGLSVAVERHGASGSGAILGTPGFASPEQLRGDPLDIRSDIYSVGATLFYLMSGRAPFEDRSTTGLIEKVATAPPPSLTTVRPDAPRRLAQVIQRCLAKTPADRFANYAELRSALEPFSSARVTPAPLIRRTVAGWIDVSFVTSVSSVFVTWWLKLDPLSPSHPGHAAIAALTTVVVSALYFGLLEGYFGAAPGKAIFGLRVVDAANVTPGPRRGIERALAFAISSQLIVRVITWLVARRVPDVSMGFLNSLTALVYVAVLFSTARPSDGYRALHDRFTRTRVVRRRIRLERRDRVDYAPATQRAPFDTGIQVGPYLVSADVRLPVSVPTQAVGFDDRLQRRVWIELLPPGTPSLPAARRDLDRPARVRWLGGRREGEECWDAYEAIEGSRLSDVIASPQPWSRVRHWLGDLGTELAAALSDGTAPLLEYDRAWIDRSDRARLTEVSTVSLAPDLPAAQRFLYGVTVGALLGIPAPEAMKRPPGTPIPMPARMVLLSLRDARLASPAALRDGVAAALAAPAVLPWRRRALQIGMSAAFPVLTAVTTAVALIAARKEITPMLFWFTMLAVLAGTSVIPALLSIVGAAVTGSGFTFRPAGAALVNRRGERVSRIRAVWRAAVTWSPIAFVLPLFAFSKPPEGRVSLLLLQTVIMAGMFDAALWAIARPTRGIQDRLSGTWIVPR